MRKLLTVLAAVVFLLFAAVLLLPSLIDWNAYKGEIADRLSAATGRPVEIAGDVNLSLLPAPTFSAHQVTIGNIQGGSTPNMVDLASLQVRVELAPLLQGKVRVERIALVEPRVLLERLADGRANWDFGKAGEGAESDGDTGDRDGGGLPDQIRLDSFRIIDGAVTYRDAASGVEERLTGLNAELRAESLSGPFRAQGELTAHGLPATFEAALGRPGGAGETPYNVSLSLAETDTDIRLSGALTTQGETAPSLRGSMRVRGADLAATLAQVNGGSAAALPPQFAQRFSLAGELAYADTHLDADKLNLQLGETSADGHASVTFGEMLEASLQLDAQRLDVDRLLAMRAEGATAAKNKAATKKASDEPDKAKGFTLPRDVRLALDLSIGAAVYRDQAIRQAQINVVMADGLVTVNQAMALLPGSSDVALFGTLSGDGAEPRFDGRVEAASDNLRVVLDWLGVSIEGVPSDRLRRLNLLADVAATPDQATLTGIDLDVDTMEFKGGVAVALRKRPGFGIGLTVDRLNLDTYLPKRSAAETAAAADAQATGDAGVAAAVPVLAVLGDFDANFDLRAGELVYQGRTARRVKLDATLHNRALDLREFSIGDLEGASARFDGSISELTGLDPSFDLNVDLDVPSPRRLAEIAGAQESVPDDLGALTLVGTAKGRLGDVALDATLQALGGTVTAEGTVEPLAAPLSFDLVLGLQHDSLSGLVSKLTDGMTLASDPGGVELASRVVGTAESFRSDRLKGKLGPVEVTGPVAVDLSSGRPKITAQLKTNTLPIEAFALAAGPNPGDSGRGGERAGGDGGGGRWSNEPIALDGLRAADLDLRLQSEAIAVNPKVRLEKAKLSATLTDGVLDLEQVSGTLFGGPVNLSGTLDARESLAATARIEAQKVDSAALFQQGFDYAGISGPLNFDIDVTTKGPSERALVESLNGEGSLSGQVTIAPQAFLGPGASKLLGGDGGAGQAARLASDLSDLFGEALGEKVRISGVTEALDFVAVSFAEEPAALSGTFSAKKGIVSTDDTRLDGKQGRGLVTGTVDLPNWRLDSRTQLFRAKDPADAPYVVARQVGPLDAPNVEITGGAFRDKLTPEALKPKDSQSQRKEKATGDKRTEGASKPPEAKQKPRKPTPDQPKKPTAEDIIRGVLDKLKPK